VTETPKPPSFVYAIRRANSASVRKSTGHAKVQNTGRYRIDRRGRCWEVRDATGDLVCLTVYKKGAVEVVRRLSTADSVSACGTNLTAS
jgi:hypothetical protein